MLLKQKLSSLISKIQKTPIWAVILTAILFVIVFFWIIYFQDKAVIYSYGEKINCVSQLTFLPGLNKSTDKNPNFIIENSDSIKIGNFEIISSKTCFRSIISPPVGKIKINIAPFGGWFAKKTYIINVSQPPVVNQEVFNQVISVSRSISMKINSPDVIFDYILMANGTSITCPVKNQLIICDINSLRLLQGTDYKIELIRMFNGQKITTLFSKNVKTLNATSIVNTSVAAGQIVYDKPKIFIFDFDKDIADIDIVLEKVEGEKRTIVDSVTDFSGKQANLTIENDLNRNSSYAFSVRRFEAEDGSTLAAPYSLDFMTSGGPNVKNVNVGLISAPLNNTIVLTFDQTLSINQDILKFIDVTGVTYRISRTNNQVFISYSNAPLCTDLKITINPGIESNYGIIQNSPWSFATRTICYSVSTIGYSKEGRSILAYTFGNGGQTILFTGSIHGNEASSKYLMDAWINELETNARSIPSNKKIVIVPTINPDGVAANRRNNSNNVDINRNFPVSDWQTDIFSPANQPVYGGGGVAPLSEPESQAIAAFTIQLQPRLTLSYHSNASYAIGNQAGESAALAATYARLTGYRNMTGVSNAFSYPITGTYDDWMRESYGLTSVLIELSSSTNPEFARNKAALWVMARY